MSGQANKISDFQSFSSDPEEQEGYYVPFYFKNWEGVQIASSRAPQKKKSLDSDGEVLMFLGKEDITPGIKLNVYPPKGDEFSYSFSGVTKAEE